MARVLVSNDDGVGAPGLRALAAALQQSRVQFLVCGPAGERSAQSHAITVGKPMVAFPIAVEGAEEAFAVEGTPADSVLLALNSSLLQDPRCDLVLSGINRGDNLGLHVIYSGTVGAAREAACKGLPAIACSLDSHAARSIPQYEDAAALVVPVVQAVLGLLPGTENCLAAFGGTVININIPHMPLADVKGYYLAYQGSACQYPLFIEASDSEQLPTVHKDVQAIAHHESVPGARVFRNHYGEYKGDDTHGSDSWACRSGWVSVTPLGLSSDIAISEGSVNSGNGVVLQLVCILRAAAQHMKLKFGGPGLSDGI